tara:strand:+ start:2499 stop:2840 length:342 start_codon:yes stop_codon:yes gene_type:complete
MGREEYNARSKEADYLWSVEPHDVQDDGTFEFGGVKQNILNVDLRPPPPDDAEMLPVLGIRLAIEEFKSCPSCGSVVPYGRPVFSCGQFMVYPCLDCEWVWCEGTTTALDGME